MADFGPGDDPTLSNYISGTDYAIGGLISLLALAAVGGAVVGLELGGATFGALDSSGFATISLADSNTILENAIIDAGTPNAAVWEATTVDEQFTVDKWAEYLNNIDSGGTPDFTDTFDLSPPDESYIGNDWFPWEQQ